MGLLTHELGHLFFAPDQFDEDEDEDPVLIGGVSSFDVMANPYGWERDPKLPGHFGPYSRMVAGWLEPVTITRNGSYAIQPSEISGLVYKINAGFPEGTLVAIRSDDVLPNGSLTTRRLALNINNRRILAHREP